MLLIVNSFFQNPIIISAGSKVVAATMMRCRSIVQALVYLRMMHCKYAHGVIPDSHSAGRQGFFHFRETRSTHLRRPAAGIKLRLLDMPDRLVIHILFLLIGNRIKAGNKMREGI